MGLTWKSVSTPTELFSYGMEFAVTGMLVTNIFQFGIWRTFTFRKKMPFWQKWRPAMLLGAAIPLILANELAVMIVYHFELTKLWTGGSWFPNTPLGIVLILMSYTGFICLTVGVVLVTNLHIKLSKRWKKLRRKKATPPQKNNSLQPTLQQIEVTTIVAEC